MLIQLSSNIIYRVIYGGLLPHRFKEWYMRHYWPPAEFLISYTIKSLSDLKCSYKAFRFYR
jgi:hypothetical protein